MSESVASEDSSRDVDTESQRRLVKRFTSDVWSGRDLDAIRQLTTSDAVVHGLGAGTTRTVDEFVAFHAGLLEAVPDLAVSLNTVVVAGDRAMAHVTIRGTPERQYGALAPTGRSFEADAFQQYRFADDRIAEVWTLPNAMGMLQDLGIFPDSPGDVLRLLGRAVKARLLGG